MRETFLGRPYNLIQQPCGSSLGLSGGVGVNVHRGTYIRMSQQLLHILGCGSVREKVGRICMPQQMEVKIIHRKIIADIICGSCCVNSCFFLVINPSVQYETKWVSERSVWMLRSDALLRYSFFYRGDNDYRNSSVSFCNAAPLLISDFFSAPLAKQKETRHNMTERTELVIFKEAWAWLLPITRLSSSARRC